MTLLYLFAVYVHIVTVAVWLGAMLFEDPGSVRLASRVAYRIRGIGGPSLVVLILTGTVMLFHRGVTWQAFVTERPFSTTFGKVLGLKLLLVLVLISLQATIGNRPSKITNYGYLGVTLFIIALSVWLVRPIIRF
jgi:hypothetical protein